MIDFMQSPSQQPTVMPRQQVNQFGFFHKTLFSLKRKIRAFLANFRWKFFSRHLRRENIRYFAIKQTKRLGLYAVLGAGAYFGLQFAFRTYTGDNRGPVPPFAPAYAAYASDLSTTDNEGYDAPAQAQTVAYRPETAPEKTQTHHKNNPKTTASKQTYFKRFGRVARMESERFNVPAEILLGLAALASDFGSNELALKHHNHFGISCDENLLEEEGHPLPQSQSSCLMHYNKAWSSFRAASLLLSSPKYAELNRVAKGDWSVWVSGLEKLGHKAPNFSGDALRKVIQKEILKSDW